VKAYKPGNTPAPAKIHRGSGALEMVRHAVELNGFLGVKVYPPVGFAPWDNARLRPHEALSPRIDLALQAFYAYCEAEEVPITAHTSAGNEYGIGFHDLVSPDRWRPVLEAHPSLRVNFGHFGHDFGLDGPRGVSATEAWIRQAASLIQTYPNVYADLSNSPLVFDTAYATRFGAALREIVTRYPKVRRRLMYGSDWWLNRLERGAETFPAAIRGALTAARGVAPGAGRLWGDEEVADVMGRNALRFLGFLDDDNRPRSGRSARRLRDFYGKMRVPPPPWLA
jgi:predicted TIM-barrel fold metal-dependent hydrolase